MADKEIDYKEYVSTLGNVETNQVAIIKKYLEEQCEKDAALKSLYRPEKINDCYAFIGECVEQMPRTGVCACVEDAVVFKMARDYFIEILPKVAETPPEVKSEQSTAKEKSAEAAAETEPGTKEENQAENENAGTMSAEAEREVAELEESAIPAGEGTLDEEPGAVAAETELETKEENQAENENAIVTDSYGFEVFGEELPKEEKNMAAAETVAETELETKEENQAENENAGTPGAEAAAKFSKEGNSDFWDVGSVLSKHGARLFSGDLYVNKNIIIEKEIGGECYSVVARVKKIEGESFSIQEADRGFLHRIFYREIESDNAELMIYSCAPDAQKTGVMDAKGEISFGDFSKDENGNVFLFDF